MRAYGVRGHGMRGHEAYQKIKMLQQSVFYAWHTVAKIAYVFRNRSRASSTISIHILYW
jgi:hypothetical protein